MSAAVAPLPQSKEARQSATLGRNIDGAYQCGVAAILLKEIKVGELSVRDVPAAVFPDNRLQVGLLGMSFLSKLSHVEVAGGRLILKQ